MTHPSFSVENDTTSMRTAIDAFVRSRPDASPYHLSAWRAAVYDAYGHESKIAIARTGDGIQGCLAWSVIRRPLGRASCSALPFCDVGGALATAPDLAAALETYAARAVAASGSAGLETRNPAQVPLSDADLAGRKVRMLLALPENADALMQSYPPKLRSQIRKAEKNGLVCAIETGAAALGAFYDVYSRNMLRLGSPPHGRAWFEAVCRHYDQDAFIAVVRHQGKPVGAGLVLRCETAAAIPWASTLVEFNPMSPNMLLYWTIQAHLCSQGVREFDFGRSTHGEGTFKFKKQWGAQPALLDWREWNDDGLPRMQGIGTGGGKLRSVVEQAWQKLPLPVANAIGPHLRRYITL